MMERRPFDLSALVQRARTGPCFICEMLAGNPDYAHHVIFEDDSHIGFLSKYPTMPGYALVCPKRHVEDVAEDLSPTEYLQLQSAVHRLARALKRELKAERIYVLSLGSLAGNSHVHVHVAPLPVGVPYEQQQFHALMAENGVIAMSDTEMMALADRLGAAYAGLRS